VAFELATRPKTRVPTLLDENGRAIALPSARRTVIEANPRGAQTYNSHPAQGLTVETLLSYYRAAESGSPIRQMDMFDDLIERHADTRGMLNDRNEDVAGCEFSVMAPANRNDKPSNLAAGALNEQLQDNPNFRQYLTHMLTAIPFGYACSNMAWDYVEGIVVPIEFACPAQRRFGAPSPEKTDEVWLIDGKTMRMVELTPGLWSCSRSRYRNPYAAGLMRSAAWWILFALTGFKQWQIFADMFGLPVAIGYYEEGAGGDSRLALEDAVRGIGQDGYAVLSSLTELVIKETARGGDSSTVFPQILRVCDAQLAKLITGGTLNTDVAGGGAGSYNAATVHESRSYKMKRYDAKCLEDAFCADIGRTFNAWNGFDRAAAPRLKMKIARDELQRAQTLEILGMGMKLSKTQAREEFNLREPSGPDDELTFQPTKPPDPGHAREEKKR
jgi:phage gp29-like protein